MPLRDYNAAVDFVDRNVAEGRGDKTAFIDPSRRLYLWRIARRGGARRSDAGAARRRAGEPYRAGDARHRRFSHPVLGSDPRRRRAGAAQHPADRRPVPLSAGRLPRQSGVRVDRAAAGDRGSRRRSAAPALDRCGRRRAVVGGAVRRSARGRKRGRRAGRAPAPTTSPIGSIRPGRRACRRA